VYRPQREKQRQGDITQQRQSENRETHCQDPIAEQQGYYQSPEENRPSPRCGTTMVFWKVVQP
jgi:hypothetical protein